MANDVRHIESTETLPLAWEKKAPTIHPFFAVVSNGCWCFDLLRILMLATPQY